MPDFTRRGFIAASLASGAALRLPQIASAPATRRVLTLVYDKSLGAMRAIEKIVPR